MAEDTSRLLDRGEPARLEVVRVNELVREMRPLVELLVGERVTVALELDDQAGDAMADRRRVEQVLLDVAASARDAMPEGGRLTIRTGNDDPSPEDRSGSGRCVAIMMTDTGAGTTSEVLADALEDVLASRDDDASPAPTSSQRLAAARRGQVTVHSKAGFGTTVIVRLPRAGDGRRR